MKKPYPTYKTTGIIGISDIPEHWEWKKAKYLFREIDIRSESGDEELLSVSHYDGVRLRREKNVSMFMAESYEGSKLCDAGDLVINIMWAWMGALGISSQEGIVSSAYGVYRPKKSDEFNNFYFDSLVRIKPYIAEYLKRSKGIHSSRWRMYSDDFFQIKFPIPPIKEQDKIAFFLKTKTLQIDSVINKKTNLIELLKEQKQAIVNKAVTRGVDPSVELKSSGLDWLKDIPEHWEVIRLTKYFESRVDYRGRTPEKAGEGIFLVTAKNIKEGKINYELSREYITPEGYKQVLNRGVPQINDLLFTTEAPLGEVALVDRIDVAFAQRIIKFSLDTEVYYPEFIKFWMMSYSFQQHLQAFATGSTAKGIKASKLNSLIGLLIPINEQKEIVSFINRESKVIEQAIARIEKEISLIQEYKVTLVAEAVTGKIDVRDWQPKQRREETEQTMNQISSNAHH
ncbi:MAG: restriction endonuclease subunit S [Phaeodactylibacter sp.]|nr:restriction endonuclease subunit S [Phaeodactylibacter sp.]